MKRVLVCGGRSFDDVDLVFHVLDKIHRSPGIIEVIHGAATGADRLANKWCHARSVACTRFPADWETHGRSAGPKRNQEMLILGRPDLVVAFPGGRGTADMVRRAKRAGVEVMEIR